MGDRKSANGAGGIERRRDRDGVLVWWARVSLPGTKPLKRKRIPIPNSARMTALQARRAAEVIAEKVRNREIVFDVVQSTSSPTTITTVRELGKAWTSGKLYEQHGKVNRLRVKATADVDAWMLKAHAYEIRTRGAQGPAFGDLPVAKVTSDDVAVVMAAHPKELRAKTIGDTYQRLRRLFDLAIFPCKLRRDGDNPVSRYFRPERDAEKLFCFLYPGELLALLRGTNAEGKVVVPLGRRVLYALGTYTGQRKGSLYAMRWKHVDVAHGTLASFKTKTGRAQYFVADPGLLTLLRTWHALCGTPGGEEPIVRDAHVQYDRKRLATALRDDLKAVGVTRAILFEDKAPNVEPLRFHDLRSTFCTWARRAGKSDAWISERTGHELSGDMINRYDRGATTLDDLGYTPFPDISRAAPELVAFNAARRIVRLAMRLANTTAVSSDADVESDEVTGASPVGARGFEPPTPRSRTATPGSDGGPAAADQGDRGTDSATLDGGQDTLATDVGQLTEALRRATDAGKWDLVGSLAAELEARRRARRST